MRDIDYLKPEKFKDYMTLGEVARIVSRDPSWLRKLEAADRIPKAQRVKAGALLIRLWSPEQIKEIVEILKKMKPGRPLGS